SWEQENVDVWVENRNRASERLMRKSRFQERANSTRAKIIANRKQELGAEVQSEVSNFEKRLQKHKQAGLAPDDPLPLQTGVLDDRELRKQFKVAMDTRKAKRPPEEAAARERRRRKFISEMEESHITEYQNRTASMLEAELTRGCEQAAVMAQRLEAILNYRDMMIQDRSWRDEMYKCRMEVDEELSLKRDQACVEVRKELYKAEVKLQLERFGSDQQHRAEAKNRRIEKLCREVLDATIIMAAGVGELRRYTQHVGVHNMDEDPLPRSEWEDVKRVFLGGAPPVVLSNCQSRAERVWGQSMLMAEPDAAAILNGVAVKSYLANQQQHVGQCEAHLEEDAEGLFGTAVNHSLGEAIVIARLANEPLPSPPAAPDVPRFELQLCLCGPTFTGKTEQALRLAQRYQLEVLCVDALLRSAIKTAEAYSHGEISELVHCGRLAQSKMLHG
ncbi:unnamed protein product, partial [Chrysoparadoxa australica]